MCLHLCAFLIWNIINIFTLETFLSLHSLNPSFNIQLHSLFIFVKNNHFAFMARKEFREKIHWLILKISFLNYLNKLEKIINHDYFLLLTCNCHFSCGVYIHVSHFNSKCYKCFSLKNTFITFLKRHSTFNFQIHSSFVILKEKHFDFNIRK